MEVLLTNWVVIVGVLGNRYQQVFGRCQLPLKESLNLVAGDRLTVWIEVYLLRWLLWGWEYSSLSSQ